MLKNLLRTDLPISVHTHKVIVEFISGPDRHTRRALRRRRTMRFNLHCGVLLDGEVGGAAGARPSSSAKKLKLGARVARALTEEVTPCPSPRRVISRIGWGEVLAFCSVTANLLDCHDATRGSFSAVMSSTRGRPCLDAHAAGASRR